MARAQVLRRTAFLVLGGAAATSQLPRRTAFAEAPLKDQLPERKPIYSSPQLVPSPPKPSSTSPVSKPNPTNPTPTDRLTEQVKHTRLFLYNSTLSAEHTFNDILAWAFRKETNLTNTIASLAPSAETGEQLLPGAIYVLVATMAGSIVARNRNIVVRATFPLAVGIAAGWALIPVTMANTAELIWQYEKKAPLVADAHLQVREMAISAWRSARRNTEAAKKWTDEKAIQSRSGIEEYVGKGK